MPRRAKVSRRIIIPDPKYRSHTVAKFINNLMHNGKKTVAQAILYEPNAAEEQDLVDALRQVSGRYLVADFDADNLKKHIDDFAATYGRLIAELGIKALRPGPSNNEKASNYANYDESKANPYPNLPDPLTLNDGQKVTTPHMWWDTRRP